MTRTPHGQVAFRIDQRTLRGRSQGNARRTLRRGSPIGAFSMRARRRRRHPKGRVRAHGARDTRAPSRRSDDHPRALHARSTARHRASPATPRQLPHVRRPGQRHASARLTDAANRRCTHRDYGPPLGVEGTPVSLGGHEVRADWPRSSGGTPLLIRSVAATPDVERRAHRPNAAEMGVSTKPARWHRAGRSRVSRFEPPLGNGLRIIDQPLDGRLPEEIGSALKSAWSATSSSGTSYQRFRSRHGLAAAIHATWGRCRSLHGSR